MGVTDATMGDSMIFTTFMETLTNARGQDAAMMMHEAIAKVIPTPITPYNTSKDSFMPLNKTNVGMQGSLMPPYTSNVMQNGMK